MAEQETSFDYKPDNQAATATDKTPNDGLSFSWTASEYIDHKQGFAWFVALAVATVLLAVGLWLLSGDYFGSGIIITLGVVVGIFARRSPRQLKYEVSGDGLKIEEKLYPFNLFKTFSVVQDGILTSIDLTPIKRFMPPVSAYFDPGDQDKILAVLEEHLPYEEKTLDRIESLTRRLRF